MTTTPQVEPVAAPPPPVAPRGLSLRTALLWVLLAGVLGQVAGALAAQLVRTLLVGAGASGEVLDGSAVLVPAVIVQFGVMLGAAWLAPALVGVPAARALGLAHAPLHVYVAVALGTLMLGPTADHVLHAMQVLAPGLGLGVVPKLNAVVAALPLWVAWPAFALLPGLSEELLFRGLLQRAAAPGAFAILLSGVGFALFHIDPHHAAGVLPLGLFLAWAGSRAGTLVTIVAHVANNSVAIVALHADALGGVGSSEPLPWIWLPPTLACTALCAFVIARSTRAPEPVRGDSPPASMV